MNAATVRSRYSSLSISLHWVMLILLVAVYACMELRSYYPKGSDFREGLKMWHFMLGLSVLLLVVIRIIARLTATCPPIVPEPPAWIILSASGKAIPFFGMDLPALVGPDKALANQVKEVHEAVATIGYFLVGLHAVAALYHHYVVKDDTLRRMMPGPR